MKNTNRHQSEVDDETLSPTAPCEPAEGRRRPSLVETAPSTTSHDDEQELSEKNRDGHLDRVCRCGKWVLVAINLAALLGSIYTALSCRFFSLQELPSIDADYVLVTEISSDAMSLGILGYSSSEVQDSPIKDLEVCTPYEAQFWNSPVGPFLMVAQFAAFLAPCLGGIACLIQLVELACPSSTRSTFPFFSLSVLLFGSATVVQGSTFVIYGDASFW